MSRVEHIGLATMYLGDSIEIMKGLEPVDHIVTDPPYEAALHASNDRLSQGRELRDKRNPFAALGFDAIDDIRADVVAAAARLSNGWFLAFCTIEGVAMWANAINVAQRGDKALGIEPLGIKYKRPCLWIKPDAMPQMNGQMPGIGSEAFITAWCGTGHSKWNAGGKVGNYICNKGGPDRTSGHPTEKPRRLMTEILADFTLPGQLILDPFAGSGTTGVAAVMDGRRFVGIEKNDHWFEVACERIEMAQRQGDMFGGLAA